MSLQVLNFDAYEVMSKKSTPRMSINSAGGIFEQRTLDGLNTNLQVWKIGYSKRKGVDVKAVGDFFTSHRGYQSFLWTPPDDIQRKFICEEYVRTLDHYNAVQSITATLEEIP